MSRLAESRLQVIHILQKQLENRAEEGENIQHAVDSSIKCNWQSTLAHTGLLSLMVVLSIARRIREIARQEFQLKQTHAIYPSKDTTQELNDTWYTAINV